MTATAAATPPPLDVERLREDFPILAQRVRGKPLVYLDNAATSQKPRAVIDAVSRFYAAENANIHRGVHYLSERATEAYDGVARAGARGSSTPRRPREIVFTRGTTEAINLVAQSCGADRARARRRDPDHRRWSTTRTSSPGSCCASRPAPCCAAAPITDARRAATSTHSTRLLGRAHAPRRRGARLQRARHDQPGARDGRSRARAAGVPVLVDGAQAAPHLPVDVQALGLRLLRLLGPQDLRPDRHRRALRARRRCSKRCRPGRAAAT